MLVLIPEIHLKKVICKLPLPLLSLWNVNTVTYSYDTSGVLPEILLDKDRQNSGRRLNCVQFVIRNNKMHTEIKRHLSANRRFIDSR